MSRIGQIIKEILNTPIFGKGKKKISPSSGKKKFIKVWTEVFKNDAEIFTGLYSGMYDISQGKLKKKSSVLKEWCVRVRNRLGSEPNKLTEKYLAPFTDDPDSKRHKVMASALLEAAAAAGIRRAEASEIIISEENYSDYGNIGEGDFEIGDTASVLAPAWYQNGKLLEKGFAQMKEDEM